MKRLGLRRDVGLLLLTLYGLGNILGAGIYVLIGKVTGEAGYAAPFSFILAFVVAAFTAGSYIELSGRYPRTAAVPVYLYHAFRRPRLSTLVGMLLVASGIVSAATLAKGLVGYFQLFAGIPGWTIIIGTLLVLGGFALAGIARSAKLAATLTIIEITGLALIVFAGGTHLDNIGGLSQNISAGSISTGMLVGAFIAFYAFIGFEDMIEMVEEIKQPGKTLPKAMLLSLGLAAAIYILVIISALLVFTPGMLAASSAPLADVFSHALGWSPLILAFIALAAIVNGILVQIIMGSRVLYGMASQGWIHGAFAKVHKNSRVPVAATMIVVTAIAVLAITFPLLRLAELTSFFILMIFIAVNLSLLVVKGRAGVERPRYEVPVWVPVVGASSALGMLVTALLFIR